MQKILTRIANFGMDFFDFEKSFVVTFRAFLFTAFSLKVFRINIFFAITPAARL
jgi:hypothetical protein